MTEKSSLKPLAIALGATFASALTVNVANAAENPFGQAELAGGYAVAENSADKAKLEGQCGEGKCGAAMMKKAPQEGQCGAQNKAPAEGQCGAMNKAQKQGENSMHPETPDNAVKPE